MPRCVDATASGAKRARKSKATSADTDSRRPGSRCRSVHRCASVHIRAAMSDILIVRQPVFDRSDSAVGYELRFRPAGDEGDPFARSYLSGSFDVLRSGLPAYVRCTRRQLVARIFDSADPSRWSCSCRLMSVRMPRSSPPSRRPSSVSRAASRESARRRVARRRRCRTAWRETRCAHRRPCAPEWHPRHSPR